MLPNPKMTPVDYLTQRIRETDRANVALSSATLVSLILTIWPVIGTPWQWGLTSMLAGFLTYTGTSMRADLLRQLRDELDSD